MAVGAILRSRTTYLCILCRLHSLRASLKTQSSTTRKHYLLPYVPILRRLSSSLIPPLQPESFTLYSNRSLAYLRLATPNAALALVDAESATSLSPFWAKGWVRKGDALVALERYQDAVVSFQEAVAVGEGKVRTGESNPSTFTLIR